MIYQKKENMLKEKFKCIKSYIRKESFIDFEIRENSVIEILYTDSNNKIAEFNINGLPIEVRFNEKEMKNHFISLSLFRDNKLETILNSFI